MANSVDPDETAHYEPSHLAILFAQVSNLIWRAERVNQQSLIGSENFHKRTG